jgi:hypothetical protein
MIAVTSRQRADNSPVLTYRHLGLVEENGKHGLLNVGPVAQNCIVIISVNVPLILWQNLRFNAEPQHKE